MIKINTIILISLLAFCSCQDNQTHAKKETKKEIEVTTKTKKTAIKPIENPPIINQNNIVAFFTKYGKEHKEDKVIIKTRLGNIHIQLFNETPLHRANFIFLINEGYFDTTCFHRVVEDFIIQAGQSDRKRTRALRKKIGYYKIPPEFTKHKHHKGTLSSARRWNQNPKKLSDAYEFFIVHKEKGLHHLNQEHTAFGIVTKGMDVVDKIAKEAIDKGEWPLEDINLKLILK